jgi:hypothetical protein
MSRLGQGWGLVPGWARWLAALVGFAFTGLMALLFIVPVAASDPPSVVYVVPVFLLSLIGVVPMMVCVLLVGFVCSDAKRRGMDHVLWTLLAALIPAGVGIILYFILREPVPVPCPLCGTPATKGHAFCSACGVAVRTACPECRQPVDPGWSHCTRCGASLRPDPAKPTPGSAGAVSS